MKYDSFKSQISLIIHLKFYSRKWNSYTIFYFKIFSLIKKNVKARLHIYDAYYSFCMLQLHVKKLFSNEERYFIPRSFHHSKIIE